MTEATAYLATIVYEDKAGKTQHIGAVVLAVDEADAIEAAVSAVSALPQCAEVIGGCLEAYAPEEIEPRAKGPIARSVAGQTVH